MKVPAGMRTNSMPILLVKVLSRAGCATARGTTRRSSINSKKLAYAIEIIARN
jgi:hypothetical protein